MQVFLCHRKILAWVLLSFDVVNVNSISDQWQKFESKYLTITCFLCDFIRVMKIATMKNNNLGCGYVFFSAIVYYFYRCHKKDI